VTFQDFARKIFFWEIAKGMALTFRSMLTKAVTRQYPEEKRPAMAGFRGLHALVRESSTGQEKCIACGLCAAICPSQCITIYTTDRDGRKVAERYEIDVLRCTFCSFCVEACPVGAVVMTEHYEYADYSREAFYYTKERLLENWDRFMAGEKGRSYLKRFWLPKEQAYGTYEGQAVFRPASAGAAEGKESD
jgi:NADH-quinone oxidoreductase subunit I